MSAGGAHDDAGAVPGETFRIRIAASGETFEVPPHKSILFVLIENGYRVKSACSDGRCGTCRTPYLAGEPQHRDSVLSEAEHARLLTVCVSRARAGEELVLDLPAPGAAAVPADASAAVVDQSICVACLTCVRACTFGAARIDPGLTGVGGIAGAAIVDPGACTGCGLCVAACPTGAIGMRACADEAVLADLDEHLGRDGDPAAKLRVVAFCCPNTSAAVGSGEVPAGVRIDLVRLPCTGRIDNLHLMRAFEAGADGVIAAGCESGRCMYARGNLNADRRVHRLADWLDDIGLDARRVRMAFLPPAGGEAFGAALGELRQDLAALGPSPVRAHAANPPQQGDPAP